MDEEEIYICFPGEVVVYKPIIQLDQNAGLLCIVQGIRKGKVELSICPSGTSNILALPEDIIESGDYGSDMYDTRDELNQLYEGFDDCDEMDVGNSEITKTIESSLGIAPANAFDTFMCHYLCENFTQAFDSLSMIADTYLNTEKKQLYFGKCMDGQGDKERALDYYMRAFHLSGSANSSVMCHIVQCYYDIGSSRDAWDWCQRALHTCPNSPMAHFLAARLMSLDSENGKECAQQLTICIMHCPVIDSEQLPFEAVEMWCGVAKLAQLLQLDSSFCIRAWLRAIGVARSVGALSSPTTQSFVSPTKTAELARVRPVVSAALLELGNLLLASVTTTCPEPCPPTDGWYTASKTHGLSSAKKKKAAKVSVDTIRGAPTTPVGWGYVRGAYAAHYWCNEISGGLNPKHRKALSETQDILTAISK